MDRGGAWGGVTFGRPFLSKNAKSLCLCPTFYIHASVHSFSLPVFLRIFLPSIVLGEEDHVDEAGLLVVLENAPPPPRPRTPLWRRQICKCKSTISFV